MCEREEGEVSVREEGEVCVREEGEVCVKEEGDGWGFPSVRDVASDLLYIGSADVPLSKCTNDTTGQADSPIIPTKRFLNTNDPTHNHRSM